MNEKVFNESVSIYQEDFNKSGYKHELKLKKQAPITPTIDSKPPFSKSVATKIGKTFLRLIDKHFHYITSYTHFLIEMT